MKKICFSSPPVQAIFVQKHHPTPLKQKLTQNNPTTTTAKNNLGFTAWKIGNIKFLFQSLASVRQKQWIQKYEVQKEHLCLYI